MYLGFLGGFDGVVGLYFTCAFISHFFIVNSSLVCTLLLSSFLVNFCLCKAALSTFISGYPTLYKCSIIILLVVPPITLKIKYCHAFMNKG